MSSYKQFDSLDAIKDAFPLPGILETTNSGKVNYCSNGDDAVIVQIGFDGLEIFDVDEALAARAHDIHTKMTRYFEGGFHRGITMLVLSITDEGYLLYGDDIDDESIEVSIEAETVEALIKRIEELD